MDLSTTERTSRINALFVELDGGASTPSESLLALKELAKHPAGSTVLAVPHNLRRLLDYATRKYKDDLNAQVEALRCIANCLLLVEEARITFVDAGDVVVVGEEVDGPQICLSELEKSSRHPVTFVLARILFLSTVAQTQAVIDVVEKFDAIRIVALKLDELTNAFITGEPMVKEAMTDILKFTFNLLMHYPKMAGEPQNTENIPQEEQKVIGDFWSDKLDGVLLPLLSAFNRLPPTEVVQSIDSDASTSTNAAGSFDQELLLNRPSSILPAHLDSPLTHIIHSLITIPINPSLKSVWFPSIPATQTSSRVSSDSSKKGKGKEDVSPKVSKSGSPSPPRPSTSGSRPSSESQPTSSLPVSGQKVPSTLDRALNVLSKTRRSLSRSPTPSPLESKPNLSPNFYHDVDVLSRAFSLLDGVMEFYLPGDVDPDDVSVRDRLKSLALPSPSGIPLGPDASSLDDPVSPLLLLLGRLCLADPTCRRRLRSWVVPKDMDRSSPLETHSSLLGRLLRLLGSVYHARTKDAAGEMLFAMCNSDATTLSALVGYGNVAGFLFNKGIMNAPPAPDGNDGSIPELPDVDKINPITGTTHQPKSTSAQDEMTEEEKEREMEKLFVLFDRLEKTGAIKPESNPVRDAIKKGMSS